MSIFSKLMNKYKRATPKQLVLSGVFMLAFAGAIAGGFASKQSSSAATYYGRDCGYGNSIEYKGWNGGCGAQSASELISDINTSAQGNTPSDLPKIYENFGLSSGDYDRFKNTAKDGIALQNGDVVVDGLVVMKDAFSIGRTKFGYSWNHSISGAGTYYASMHTDVLGSDMPVMVMFDDEGSAKFVVIKACGNPVEGAEVKSGGECKQLTKTPVEGKENTYKFTTEATTFGHASIVKYEYFYNEGNGDVKFAETNNGGQAVEKTFTKAATVKVKVTISLPGGKFKTVTSDLCAKQVGVVQKEFLHICDALVTTSTDNKTFRFTVNTKQSNGVTVKSADFKEGGVTVKGVTQKDGSGNIYRDYTFEDYTTHTVTATKVTFVVEGKDVAVVTPEGNCKASVTRDKAPECKPGIPVGDDRCKDYCKPGIEVGSKDCEELPVTGPGGVAGLFVGVSAAGAAAHRLFVSRRARRNG